MLNMIIKQKIMTLKSSKQKGKALESYTADRIRERGLDSRVIRDGASGAGNREKRDVATSVQINGKELGIECKNHKIPHIKDWWKQTEKLEEYGFEPVLVYKLGGESMEETKVVIRLSTFIDILAKLNKPTITEPNKEFEWDIVGLQNAIKKVRKHLNKH